MYLAEIPQFIDEKIKLANKTELTNGYTVKDTLSFKIGNKSVLVNRIKGGLKKMSCAVFHDSQNGEYYKIGGTFGMITRIEYEYLGISASLSINDLSDLSSRVTLITAEDSSVHLPMVRSPYFGCTLELLLKSNDGDRDVSNYMFSVYGLAFLQASEMLTKYGIFISDPNPGNIILRKTGDNVANIIFIDFTGSSFYREPNYKNTLELQNRFQKQAELIKNE